MKKYVVLCLLILSALALAACQGGAMNPIQSTVTGNVTVSGDVAIPADATVTVNLVDLTLQPGPGITNTLAPAAVVGDQQINW